MDALSEESSPKTHALIGAAFEVHNELGPGFLESVYQEALGVEFVRQGIPYEREVPIQIAYKGAPLRTRFKADFLAWGDILVELKASASIGRIEEAQVIHYLRATGLQTGLLINFGSTSVQVRRLSNHRAGESWSSPSSLLGPAA